MVGWIATCGNDRLVKLWSTADGKLVASWPGTPRTSTTWLSIRPANGSSRAI